MSETGPGTLAYRYAAASGLARRATDTCTCPWWGRHQGTRGPCRHVLAARMVLAGNAR